MTQNGKILGGVATLLAVGGIFVAYKRGAFDGLLAPSPPAPSPLPSAGTAPAPLAAGAGSGALPGATAPEAGGKDYTGVVVVETHRRFAPGPIVLSVGHKAQRATVAADGVTITKQGPLVPMTPNLQAQYDAAIAASTPIAQPGKGKASVASGAAPASPAGTSPLTSIPPIHGLPPAAQGTADALSKLLPSAAGAATGALGQALSGGGSSSGGGSPLDSLGGALGGLGGGGDS